MSARELGGMPGGRTAPFLPPRVCVSTSQPGWVARRAGLLRLPDAESVREYRPWACARVPSFAESVREYRSGAGRRTVVVVRPLRKGREANWTSPVVRNVATEGARLLYGDIFHLGRHAGTSPVVRNVAGGARAVNDGDDLHLGRQSVASRARVAPRCKRIPPHSGVGRLARAGVAAAQPRQAELVGRSPRERESRCRSRWSGASL